MHLYVRETSGRLQGEISVPASKYHAHRALMLASLAEGESRIKGGVAAKHVQSTIEVLTGLGTQIEKTGDGFLVRGGLPYRPLRDTVSVGSSGTTLYFMIGLASLADAPVTITGQKYFQRRPVGPLLEALADCGVELSSANATPPITVAPKRPAGGRVSIAGTLSQWISGLIILAPFASGPTTIEVEGTLNEQPYVELTVNMMRDFGLEVGVADDWRRFEIEGNQTARAADVTLPPDIGSLAFGLAATSIHPSDVFFHGVSEIDGARVDHPEAHFLDVVAEMGLPMELDREAGGMRVRHDGVRLRGVEIDCRPMPDMLPVLSTMGQFAEGETRFSNVAHVRLKESDRVVSMLQLNRMGGDVEEQGDELVVRGIEGDLTGSPLSSFNDHRVHMSLTVAASPPPPPASKYHAHRLISRWPSESRIGVAPNTCVDDRVLTGLGPDRETPTASSSAAASPTARCGHRLGRLLGHHALLHDRLASLADAPVTITGQKYFQRRPVGPLLEALADAGSSSPPPTPRRRSRCAARPRGGTSRSPGRSASGSPA